jgi:hypothetical protein
MNEIREVISDKNMFIKGEVPGAGKSYVCMNAYKDKNILVVCAVNSLCYEINKKGFNAITMHNLLGLLFNGETNEEIKKYDVSEIDIIVFEEIAFYDIETLEKLYKFILDNKHIQFFANGDTMQNEPIDNDLKVDDIGLYFEKIHNKIFPNQISLKLSKRCLDENQNRKIELLGKEFREHIHDVEYCKKLIIGMPEFKKIYKPEKIKTKKNVVATHRTSNWVNGLLHEKKNNQKYYVGLNLLGKNTYK